MRVTRRMTLKRRMKIATDLKNGKTRIYTKNLVLYLL